MRLLRELAEKPWLPAPEPLGGEALGGTFRLPAATLGLRVFLAVVTVLFTLLLFAYAQRMAFEEWRPSPQPRLLWLNTVILIAASIAMQWASIAVRRERPAEFGMGLTLGGVLAAGFLMGQLVAWRQLSLMIPFDVTDAAVAFFYLITALHGLHLMGGLVAWAGTTAGLWQGVELGRLRLRVELLAVYWHFLLAVWLVLFGLLFSGNENLEILLAICGLR